MNNLFSWKAMVTKAFICKCFLPQMILCYICDDKGLNYYDYATVEDSLNEHSVFVCSEQSQNSKIIEKQTLVCTGRYLHACDKIIVILYIYGCFLLLKS